MAHFVTRRIASGCWVRGQSRAGAFSLVMRRPAGLADSAGETTGGRCAGLARGRHRPLPCHPTRPTPRTAESDPQKKGGSALGYDDASLEQLRPHRQPPQNGLAGRRYETGKRLTMIFDAPSRVASDPDQVTREFWTS